ncbi:MAG: SpoIIE family protein phosphatase [Phycisphaerae bacterium]|nr:SpoIIE family protein phosphatase [Phycisphaerae bacterium]
MQAVDLTGNDRIPILMETVAALSRARTPQQVLGEFSAGIEKLEGRDGYVSLSTRGLEPGSYRITRLIRDDDMATGMTATDTWSKGPELPIHRGGFFGSIVEQGRPQVIRDLKLTDDPIVGDQLAAFGSLMAVPLFDDGKPLNWAVVLRRDPAGFNADDLEDLILRGNLIGTAIRNVLANQQLRDAKEQIDREVHQIARIQRALLPAKMPAIPGLALGASYETFDTAGGDLYDFVPLRRLTPDGPADPRGPWMIHIADAAGHGPAAATVVAMLNAILSASPAELDEPGDLLRFANRHLYAKRLDGTFVTAILARYDPVSRWLTYARAGHPPALLMTPDPDGARLERLEEAGGLPLGIEADVHYDEQTVEMKPGQTLVLYTDGVTEAMSPTGAQFEVGGIERSLNECSGEPDCVIGHVGQALRAHEAGRRPADDQTVLVLKVL